MPDVIAADRLHEFYEADESGCWIWNRHTQTSGYGQIRVAGRLHLAHRLVYTMLVGEIPSDGVMDHKCHVRRCVNPDHLQVVTNKQNCENLTLSKANSSGIRGVTWDKRTRSWMGHVKHNYVSHHVGRFSTIEDAERAVVAKRNELFSNNLQDR